MPIERQRFSQFLTANGFGNPGFDDASITRYREYSLPSRMMGMIEDTVKLMILTAMGNTAKTRFLDNLKWRGFKTSYLAGITVPGENGRVRSDIKNFIKSQKASILQPACRNLLMEAMGSMAGSIRTAEKRYNSLLNSYTHRFGRFILSPLIALNDRIRA
jgi:hypothetical protein